MRAGTVLFSFLLLALTGCEKDFDEKYQENLEQLNQEAREIEARLDQQLAEGLEADRVIDPEEKAGNADDLDSEAAD